MTQFYQDLLRFSSVVVKVVKLTEIIFNNNGFVFQFSEVKTESSSSSVLAMTEEQQNQLQSSGLEELKEKTAKLKGKESETWFLKLENT